MPCRPNKNLLADHQVEGLKRVAAQALVKVKGHAFVLRLFSRMPAPKGFEGVFCFGKPIAILVHAFQSQVAKNRGVVLKSGGDGQLVQITLVAFAEKLFAPFFQALLSAGPPVVDKALLFQMRVVERMQVAVGGFLTHKTLGNLLEFGVFRRVGQVFGAIFDRVDERLFTDRKAHRQSVGIGCEKSVAAVPVARKTLAQVHAEAANGQFGRGCGCAHGVLCR